MGNCLRHESPMVWAGEDWGSPARGGEKEIEIEEEGLLKNNSNAYSSNSTTKEVKIKITKRQLEELLGKVHVKDMSVQQVLAQLISVSDDIRNETHHRSWRPALQSIPEVN